MKTWVIGDVQGHGTELKILLNRLNMSEDDRLWFVGDLVNRGPHSLETLRLVMSFGSQACVILGNHDLALLTTYAGHRPLKTNSDLKTILSADDKDELLEWLALQPLVHYDSTLKACMIHAGLYPAWSIERALELNEEYQTLMRDRDTRHAFLNVMFGNTPTKWNDRLKGHDRIRFFVNACTRMRCVDAAQNLDFSYSGSLETVPDGLTAWFCHLPSHTTSNTTLYFGHWAALLGNCPHPNVINTDTGCCWGGALSATCIETGERLEVQQIQPYRSNPNIPPTVQNEP